MKINEKNNLVEVELECSTEDKWEAVKAGGEYAMKYDIPYFALYVPDSNGTRRVTVFMTDDYRQKREALCGMKA